MKLSNIIGAYALVAKVNVSDLGQSVQWYIDKLNLDLDQRFTTSSWAQLTMDAVSNVAVGLNLDAENTGTGGAVTTFVVDDIEEARNGLINNGVEVGPITDVGEGVLLAFFSDPDGNSLGLRQNSASQPKVSDFSQ